MNIIIMSFYLLSSSYVLFQVKILSSVLFYKISNYVSNLQKNFLCEVNLNLCNNFVRRFIAKTETKCQTKVHVVFVTCKTHPPHQVCIQKQNLHLDLNQNNIKDRTFYTTPIITALLWKKKRHSSQTPQCVTWI